MTVSESLRINARLSIPRSELRFSFVRSSGPGGQNVNKVASKAVLRWAVATSASLSDDVRVRLAAANHRRINDRGELILTSQRYRDQARNIGDCLEKLRQLILSAASPPRPRKKTRVPKSAHESRLRNKRSIAEKKQRRRRQDDD
ncbi:MAG: alternative ribosome rescue aminoacyl-tRNA hydrolase ArfB [Pirellulales bacterium]